MSETQAGTLRITLVRSTIGRPAEQGRTVASLGLRKLHSSVERPDNPSIRGMVTKIRHLLEVEELPAVAQPKTKRGAKKTDGAVRSDA